MTDPAARRRVPLVECGLRIRARICIRLAISLQRD
jgi:hypothetical protein